MHLNKKLTAAFFIVITLLFMSFLAAAPQITIFLAGYSTVPGKVVKAFPQTDWGIPFHAFIDSSVTVKNMKRNGHGTKSFIAHGGWYSIVIKRPIK